MQSQKEINNYNTNFANSITKKIQEYKEVNKIQKKLEDESEKKINNQLKSAEKRIQRANSSADNEVDK